MGHIEQRSQRDQDGAALRVVLRIADVPAAEWDACARGTDSSGNRGRPDNPLISHTFLHALEESGSATRTTGWLPQHLLLEDPGGGLAGCMPCYLKSHSYGEYVFDHGWADAYERAGGDYYPKLQCSVPFTPVTGRRLLVREGPNRAERESILLQAATTLTERLRALLAPHHLPHARGMGTCWRARLSPAQRPAIPLAERGLPKLRGFLERACLTQTQIDPRRAQARH